MDYLSNSRKFKNSICYICPWQIKESEFLKNYYNSILIKGDVIIAISKHIKDNIVNVFPNVKNKVSIVYRGVDLENFNLNNISNTRIVNQSKLLEFGMVVL